MKNGLAHGETSFFFDLAGWGGGGALTDFLAIIALSKFPWVHKKRLLPITGIVVSPVVYQEDNMGQLITKNGYFVLGAASQKVLLLFSEKQIRW